MNWTLLANSLGVSLLTTAATLILGLLAALWLTGMESGLKKLFLFAAIVALALPPFLVTSCWLRLLGHSGVWRDWLPFNIYSLGGTVWILTLLNWPLALFLILGAWQKLQPSQLECDVQLRGWPLIRCLLIPLARSNLGLAVVLIFVLAFNNFAVPAILQTKVFPAELWVSFNTTFSYRTALLLSSPLLAAPLLLVLWLGRRGLAWPQVETHVPAVLFRRQLGPAWFCCAGGVTMALVLFAVGLPLAGLLGSARIWKEISPAFLAGQSAFWHSFTFATVTATLCAALSLASIFHKRKSPSPFLPLPNPRNRSRSNGLGRGHGERGHVVAKYNLSSVSNERATSGQATCRWLLGALLWLPFFVPGVLLGIGLIFVLNRPFLDAVLHSTAIVILGFTLRYLALSWNSAGQALTATDPDLTAAARLEGASRWQILRHVHGPQIASPMAAAWYVTYLFCLWDVETLVFIVPPGGETLSLRIFNLLHYGWNDQVYALCALLLGLAVLPALVWQAACLIRKQASAASAVLLLAWIVGPGCAPSASNSAPIQSKLFSEVQIIGVRGTVLGQFNKPRSLAVDALDNLYVVDMTGRVQKFSSNGVFLAWWQMPQTDKGKPKGMCRDNSGDIIVVEPHYSRINHFTTDGKLVAQWGEPGAEVGQLTQPRAVAINSRGQILVTEYMTVDRVQCFSKQGRQFLFAIGQKGHGPGEFNRPEGIGVDSRDHIYVADSCNHRLQVFSADGQFVRAYGKAGVGAGEFSYPYDVQVDKTGLQYVCEFGNSRVQVLDEHDRAVEILGSPGSAPGQFSNPWALALDSEGNLYVADSMNHRVQKFIRRPGASTVPVASAAGKNGP